MLERARAIIVRINFKITIDGNHFLLKKIKQKKKKYFNPFLKMGNAPSFLTNFVYEYDQTSCGNIACGADGNVVVI